MAQIYTFPGVMEEFSPAFKQFNHLIDDLRSPEASQMEHGEVEDLIEREGREILRCLLQGHLELRASEEPQWVRFF